MTGALTLSSFILPTIGCVLGVVTCCACYCLCKRFKINKYLLDLREKICQRFGLVKSLNFPRHYSRRASSWASQPCLRLGKLKKWMKLRKNNDLTRVDMDKYFKNFCMESDYPDQIKFKPLNSRSYTRESGPLTLAVQFRSKDPTFELGKMHGKALNRFVELLPSLTLSYFSLTSKDHYLNCLDVRGIEFSHFFQYVKNFDDEKEVLSKNGRRIGNIGKNRAELYRFVLCFDTYKHSGKLIDCQKINKVYRQLSVSFWTNDFNEHYEHVFRNLLHDNVHSVKLFIERRYGSIHEPPEFPHILKLLGLCKTVKQIGISIQGSSVLWDFPLVFARDPIFEYISLKIEKWALTRPDLTVFKLIYKNNGFMLHDDKLKLMQRLFERKWYLVENFSTNFRFSPARHDAFLEELQCPYSFKPFHCEDYVIFGKYAAGF